MGETAIEKISFIHQKGLLFLTSITWFVHARQAAKVSEQPMFFWKRWKALFEAIVAIWQNVGFEYFFVLWNKLQYLWLRILRRIFHTGPASISTCFDVIDALSRKVTSQRNSTFLVKWLTFYKYLRVLVIFFFRSSGLLYTIITRSWTLLVIERFTKWCFKNTCTRCNENEVTLHVSYEKYRFIDKKAYYPVRLKCM